MNIKSVKPKVTLLRYTPEPEKTVALAAKLCYSDLDIDKLKTDTEAKALPSLLTCSSKWGIFRP